MRDPRIRSYQASAAIGGYLVAAGAGAGTTVRQASAATDKIIGISERMGAVAAGDMADVIVSGPVEARAGGTFSAFDPLTADAQGRVVLAAPTSGQTVRIVGYAQDDAVVGDIVVVLVGVSLLKG